MTGDDGSWVLSQDEDVEAHALRRRGWSIAAIARHLNRDPRTIKAYLSGERVVGYRRQPVDAFAPFLEYCRLRLTDDPHLWSSVLFDELIALGYLGGYSTFTRALRRHEVRPHCEPCQGSDGRDVAIIEHPPGEEIQLDWLELPRPPEHWGLGKQAHLLVGALSHSGRWRAVLADSEDFPHLVQALDQVLRRLGGVSRVWRFDRMSTVFDHQAGEVTSAFAAVAKYYGATAVVCPPRRGNRKGVVEKTNRSAAQRWWRTLPDSTSITAAQAGVDRLAEAMDGRRRKVGGLPTTVGELADAEQLAPVPEAPFPATLEVMRIVSPQALVEFDGNAYSVPPGLAGQPMTVRHRLGSGLLHLITARGAVVAEHDRAPAGAGQVVRDGGHVAALESAVLAAFSSSPPCPKKVRRPPTPEALAEADRLRGLPVTGTAARVVIDMSTYVAVANRLQHQSSNQDPEEASP